jgi:hypothetical protein
MKSTLAALQVLLSAWFFIVFDWPLGLQTAMMLVMILACVNAQLPFALLARTVVISVASALPLAAVFYFLVMPRVDSFTELAPWLALFFFPFLYAIAGRNPSTSMGATISVLLANSLISISTAPPSYRFASFANLYLGMSGGFSVALILAYLFETRTPRGGLHKLVSATLLEAADYLRKLEDPSRTTSDRAVLATAHRKQSLRTLGQIEKLSALVDYEQDPHITRNQMQSVLRTLDTLAIRLAWVDCVSAPPESKPESVKRATAWCVESLAATGHALAAFQPLAIQQPASDTFDDLETAALRTGQPVPASGDPTDATRAWTAFTASYRSLARAILDCENKLKSVDWKRWCQTRF